jgi:hypothetical protein
MSVEMTYFDIENPSNKNRFVNSHQDCLIKSTICGDVICRYITNVLNDKPSETKVLSTEEYNSLYSQIKDNGFLNEITALR